MKTTLLIALLAFSTQAFATGGIHCEIKDANLEASFGGVLSHSIPSSPFQVNGTVTLKKKFLSEAIPAQPVTDFAQYWEADKELKALLYFEPTEVSKHMTMRLRIDTKLNSKTYEYNGTYRMHLTEVDGKPVTFSGKVTCSIE